MSAPARYVELFTLDPRSHSLIGYEVVADNDAPQNGRTLVLKRKDAASTSTVTAPNKPVGKGKHAATVPAPPAPKPRARRRTKAELEAAGVRSRATTPPAAGDSLDDRLAAAFNKSPETAGVRP